MCALDAEQAPFEGEKRGFAAGCSCGKEKSRRINELAMNGLFEGN